MEYCAGRAGAATEAANSYTQTARREDGTTYLKKLRDALPPPTKRATPRTKAPATQRKAEQPAGRTEQLAGQAPGRQPGPALAAPPPPEPHATEDRRQAATRAKEAGQTRALEQEARFLAGWHADMACRLRSHTADSNGPAAGERLAALRERIRARTAE